MGVVQITSERDITPLGNYFVANIFKSQDSVTSLRLPLSVLRSDPPENVEVTPDIKPTLSVFKPDPPKNFEATAEYVEYGEENQKPEMIKPLTRTSPSDVKSPEC